MERKIEREKEIERALEADQACWGRSGSFKWLLGTQVERLSGHLDMYLARVQESGLG